VAQKEETGRTLSSISSGRDKIQKSTHATRRPVAIEVNPSDEKLDKRPPRIIQLDEWRASWSAPLIAMLGVSGVTLFPYTSSLLMNSLTNLFGWTRSEFSLSFVFQMIIGLFIAPMVGRLIARHGARRVLLIGIPLAVFGFSSLALVGSSIWQWWTLAVVQGVTIALVFPVGWIAAVSSRFEKSRGSAIAVTLAGVGLGAFIWPELGSLLVQSIGWRATLPALALCWGTFIFPLTFIFLPDSEKSSAGGNPQSSAKSNLSTLLKTRLFLTLASAGGLFLLTIWAFNLHLVAILSQLGYSSGRAARIAGLAGLAAIVGRIGTGLLLDLLPTRSTAIVSFLIPLPAILMLWNADGTACFPTIAVILLGMSLGSETDIVAYISTRQFAPEDFAPAYASISAIFAIFSACGPLMASYLFDHNHSYRTLFGIACALILISSALIATVPLSSGREAARRRNNSAPAPFSIRD
jgi:MFS family permease